MIPLTSCAALAAVALTPAAHETVAADGLRWDARAVEHLLNRAGFGARPDEIAAGVALGPEELVRRLVTERAYVEPFFVQPEPEPDRKSMGDLPREEQQKRINAARQRDRLQAQAYIAWWFERMASGEDPLREKMALFWHGFFTTSVDEVNRRWLCIEQHGLFRELGLGSYADLLRAVARDPAMLVYLDNQVNRKGKPNENLARELLELFTLGQGNYAEDDVKEAARALTGRGVRGRNAEYAFDRKQHDAETKSILGHEGRWDGDDLVRILLEQDACPRHVARRLIAYFEGVEPDPERLESYALTLREHDYALQPFLTRLFLDPGFYRDEVVGARVLGPVEWMVGTSHRLGTSPPPVFLAAGAALLGQRVFAPPSVQGWDEGEAWITTSSLMQRGNLAGLLLGVVRLDDLQAQADLDEPAPEGGDPGESMQPSEPARAKPAPPKGPISRAIEQALRRLESNGGSPSIHLKARLARAGARTDAEIVGALLDELLAIPAPAETRSQLVEFLARERRALEVEDGELLDAGPRAEHLLRRLAHLALSLPEAQLS